MDRLSGLSTSSDILNGPQPNQDAPKRPTAPTSGKPQKAGQKNELLPQKQIFSEASDKLKNRPSHVSARNPMTNETLAATLAFHRDGPSGQLADVTQLGEKPVKGLVATLAPGSDDWMLQPIMRAAADDSRYEYYEPAESASDPGASSGRVDTTHRRTRSDETNNISNVAISPSAVPEFGQIQGVECGDGSVENCLLYAINQLDGSRSHPYEGRSGVVGEVDDPDVEEICEASQTEFVATLKALLERDGLRPVTTQGDLAEGEKLIAAYVDTEDPDCLDWHFARLDADGGWSEKFAGTAPKRVEEGKVENRDDDCEFVGYYAYK